MKRTLVLILALLLTCCSSNVNPKLVLKKSEAILHENFEAKAVFVMTLKTPKFVDRTVYTMKVIRFGNETKIAFLNYSFSPKTPVHERMKIALKDAWIIDDGSHFYLYTPHLKYVGDKVGLYGVAEGIPRYTYLPFVTCLDVARTFDKAENVRLVGEEGKCYVISYELSYPTVRFSDRAKVKVWISDYVPVKAEIDAKYHDTEIRMVTTFENFTTNVIKVNFSLRGLTVMKRY